MINTELTDIEKAAVDTILQDGAADSMVIVPCSLADIECNALCVVDQSEIPHRLTPLVIILNEEMSLRLLPKGDFIMPNSA